jgi:hypothetical protein
MQNISLNVKPLSAKGITLLVFGIALIAIPALTQSIINLSLIALNIKLSLPTTIALLQNMTWLNLIPKIVGLSVVSALIIRSHLKVDSTKTKRQITKVSIIGLTALMFVGALIIETPVASAQATALTGYILDTPLPIADWYIGTYGTGNYFAINGSNWDNLMRGVGSTAWAAYATNYTKVEELVLASVTSGSVYLKDVPFDLALMGNIPENVQVECNYQGVTYKYINSASSLGSPYTISVGQGPNAGYYLAQDSGDRICFTSTDAVTVMQNAVNVVGVAGGGEVFIKNCGTPYIITKPLETWDGTTGYKNLIITGDYPELKLLNNTTFPDVTGQVFPAIIYLRGTNNIVSHLVLNGNSITNFTHAYHGIWMHAAIGCKVEYNEIKGIGASGGHAVSGIDFGTESWHCSAKYNIVHDCTTYEGLIGVFGAGMNHAEYNTVYNQLMDGECGIELKPKTNAMQGFVVNNVIYNCPVGIRVNGGPIGGLVAGNLMRDITTAGVWLGAYTTEQAPVGVTVKDNVMRNAAIGIRIEGGTDITIANNQFFSYPTSGGTYAISIAAGVLRTHINDNLSNLYASGFLNDLGTNTTQAGNTVNGVYIP